MYKITTLLVLFFFNVSFAQSQSSYNKQLVLAKVAKDVFKAFQEKDNQLERSVKQFTFKYFQEQDSEEAQVKSVIETFFEGFHKGDTTLMKSVMMPKMTMQTTFYNKKGEGVFKDDGGSANLLKAISERPDDQKWDERLLDFNIQIDANMANAWVDYEFWFNGNFSHCGVNSFQLVKTEGKWRIIYLIDSRRRKGCNQ